MKQGPIRPECVLVACLAFASFARDVQAAPYCLSVQGIPDECIYVDGAECQARATKLGGVCVANQNTVAAVTSGAAEYCLVDGGAAECIYADRNACAREAVLRRALCLDRGSVGRDVDPFATVRPYR